MPVYEYICLDCRYQFEALRSMSEADAPINCQDCSSERTSRMLSVFFARSGGQVLAGGNNSGCASCQSTACATCSR